MNNGNEIAKKCQEITNKILENISCVVIGKDRVIERMLICLLSGGHVLIEDVPGIGKTTIVNSLTKSLQLDFQRIQFTPDLMPSDVTGFNLYNPKTGGFEFQDGAVMTQILLADEINRTSPRTQSALLEAMQEGQVTVEGKTYPLPNPFMVLATQNPIEHVGTYPLPEAQLDRFMMRISVGYPSLKEEMDIISLDTVNVLSNEVKPAAGVEEIIWMREQIKKVHVEENVKKYLLDICRETREHEMIELGVSPRASQMLLYACSAYALLHGREYVIPDDIKELAHDVLDHRIILKPQARGKGYTAHQALAQIIENTVVPR